MSTFKQHAYVIPTPKKGEKTKLHRIKSGPFHRDHELLDLVNQGGKIKLHALVDEELPVGTVEVLVVGTGNEVPDDLIDRIQKIGSLLINDGQFGYHYYLVSPAEGEAFGGNEVLITIKFDDRKGDASDLEDTITQFNSALHAFGMTLSFEGDDTIVLTFRHPGVRQTREFKQLMGELYAQTMVTSVNVS